MRTRRLSTGGNFLLALVTAGAMLGVPAAATPVAAAATYLTVNLTYSGANYISGAPLTMTVTARNSNGTVDTSYAGTVRFTSTDTHTAGLSDYTFVPGDNGAHVFNGAILQTAGPQTITATDTGTGTITGTSNAVVVRLKMAFSQQPGGGTGGVAWSTQPIVRFLTYADTTATNTYGGNGVVTLALSQNTGGGTLSGCTPTAGDDGYATFTACKIDKVGTYSLTATSPYGVAVTSNSFAITAGPAYGLAFTIYPGSPTTTSLGTISVQIVDQGGNFASGNPSATIALSLSSNPGGSTLGCTGSGQTVGGVATFTNCTLTGGTPIKDGYRITATATTSSPSLTVTTVQGALFNVTSGPATKLQLCWGTTLPCVTTPPVSFTGGIAFVPQPVVRVLDTNNNTVTADNTTTVALSIAAGTPTSGGPGTLTCTNGLTMRVTNGVAAYAGCQIDKVGTAYKLFAASSPTYTSSTSNAFNIVAGAPVKLVFSTQPNGGTSRTAWTTQPVVAITDAGGNVVTTTTATITLAIGTNPAAGTLTCTNGNARVTSLGVATFAGCSIDNAGIGYTLTATASNVSPAVTLTSATSNAFSITAPAAQIALSATRTVITWKDAVTLTVQFGTNGANKPFVLQRSIDNVSWSAVPYAPVMTNSLGSASFTSTPDRNYWYRVAFAGSADLSAANSNTVRVVVRQIALLRPLVTGVKVVSKGSKVTFTTTVRPARADLPVKTKVTFTFKLYRAGHLVYNGRREVYIDSAGRASWTWTFGSSGDWYVRAIANPTPVNANSVWSQIDHYRVP